MDTAYVCLALAGLLGIHTMVTLAVPRAAEFLLIKISIMETEKRGKEEEKREERNKRHE